MQLPSLLTSALLSLALAIGACSPRDSASSAAPAKREVTLETVARQAKGFSVGALMSANIVYVFFDAQCPHCGHLWQASEALHKKIRFIWIPVGMINASSTAQGATLMMAANPAALMAEHEALLLAGKGGISGSSSASSEMAATIKSNTELLNSFGVEGVPFVVAKNQKTGLTVSRDGAMASAALAEFLGVDLP